VKKVTKYRILIVLLVFHSAWASIPYGVAGDRIGMVSSYEITKGIHKSGDLSSLQNYDSDRLVIESGLYPKPLQSNICQIKLHFSYDRGNLIHFLYFTGDGDEFNIIVRYADGSESNYYSISSTYSPRYLDIDREKIVDYIIFESQCEESSFQAKLDFCQIIAQDIYADIVINSPNDSGVYGTNPSYSITITHPYDLNDVYYYFNDNSESHYPINFASWISGEPLMGNFDVPEWNLLNEGSNDITFVAINDINVKNQKTVSIIKDSTAPIVSINNPQNSDIYGNTPPDFELQSSSEWDQNSHCYRIDESDPIYFTDNIGTIDINLWESLSHGFHTLTFYEQDLVGNPGEAFVSIFKDIIGPDISINFPTDNSYFNSSNPPYNIGIVDEDLWQYGYKIDDGNEYILIEFEGNLDYDWELLSDGFHELKFFSKDIYGNMNWELVKIYKDTNFPEISINSPLEDNVYGVIAPNYSIIVEDVNLFDIGYYIDGWYSESITKNEGQINQSIWDLLMEGTHDINFWARDLADNIQWNHVSIKKDTQAPTINIISPTLNQVSEIVPYYDLDVEDANIDSVYYSLDGNSTNFFIYSSTGYIDLNLWDSITDGDHIITFYANDIVGNLAQSSVIVIKDTTDPEIIFVNPNCEEDIIICGVNSPIIEISIEEPNLRNFQYQINFGPLFPLNSQSFMIDPILWDSLNDGLVSITVYAKDVINHEAVCSINIIKDISPPVIYCDLDNSYWGSDPPQFHLSTIETNISSIFYIVNDDETRYYLNPNNEIDDTLNQSLWASLSDGDLSLSFCVKDRAGNMSNLNLTITKDTKNPELSVISPISGNYYNIVEYELDILENNLDSIWYQLGSDDTIYYLESENGLINLSRIEDGDIVITFYCQDYSNHISNQTVNVKKDTIFPKIEIVSPKSKDLYSKNTPPDYELIITDITLNESWYCIDDFVDLFYIDLNNPSGIIDADIWSELKPGEIIISFYARDLAGNLELSQVSITKDVGEEEILNLSELDELPSPVLIALGVTVVVAVSIITIIKKKTTKN